MSSAVLSAATGLLAAGAKEYGGLNASMSGCAMRIELSMVRIVGSAES
jgi:hypothetical protein